MEGLVRSEEEEAFDLYGPKRDNLFIVIPITVIYVIILLSGLIGNISTCVVISRNKSMHTATNYYLFSLAISDLLLLVSGLPPEIYSMWSRYPYIFGNTFCILRGLFAETSANATVLTITAFTVERYVAICHPFLSHTMSKLSRVIKIILLIWCIAVGFAIPQAIQFEVSEDIEGNSHTSMCHILSPLMEYSFDISTLVFFVIPMTLITVLYAMIGLKLKSSTMVSNQISLAGVNKLQAQSSRRVLKML
ncbi:PREDICTED: neuromedin-U receptor 2-like, partial [Nicrophorus vespilloides]|uniref:Neuromedin-U receptor 2-like n=1 Tax=Nicrophorus vespilloides TaxID=110193 RepID=A0ABM1N0Y5_NICVS